MRPPNRAPRISRGRGIRGRWQTCQRSTLTTVEPTAIRASRYTGLTGSEWRVVYERHASRGATPSCGSASVELRTSEPGYRRSAGRSSRARRCGNERWFRKCDRSETGPLRRAFGDRRYPNGARADDRDDRTVEVAVIPKAVDPRRVGRRRISRGSKPDEQCHEQEQRNATAMAHGV